MSMLQEDTQTAFMARFLEVHSLLINVRTTVNSKNPPTVEQVKAALLAPFGEIDFAQRGAPKRYSATAPAAHPNDAPCSVSSRSGNAAELTQESPMSIRVGGGSNSSATTTSTSSCSVDKISDVVTWPFVVRVCPASAMVDLKRAIDAECAYWGLLRPTQQQLPVAVGNGCDAADQSSAVSFVIPKVDAAWINDALVDQTLGDDASTPSVAGEPPLKKRSTEDGTGGIKVNLKSSSSEAPPSTSVGDNDVVGVLLEGMLQKKASSATTTEEDGIVADVQSLANDALLVRHPSLQQLQQVSEAGPQQDEVAGCRFTVRIDAKKGRVVVLVDGRHVAGADREHEAELLETAFSGRQYCGRSVRAHLVTHAQVAKMFPPTSVNTVE